MQSLLVSLTPGRAASLVALVVALISVVLGGLALARATRVRAFVALALALAGLLLGGRHLATATGAIGTGSGRLGALVALALALIGLLLGGLALVRSARSA
jgi:hypothetical protein